MTSLNFARFAEIAEIVMGQSPPGNSYNLKGVGLPLINGPTEFTDRFPVKKQWTSNPTKTCKLGDILLCVRGSSTGRINISNDIYCIGRGIAAIRAKNDMANTRYLEQLLLFETSKILRSASGSTFYNIDKKSIANIDVYIPSISEQQQIVNILGEWDTAIEKTGRLIEAKERHFSYLVNRLVSDNTHPRAFVRDVTIELSYRNNGEQCQRVLSVTNVNGFILPEDQFERRVASEDLSNYKLVRRGQYAYNPSRINVGSIARLDDWPEGVLSPMYVVFSLNDNKINSDFFHYWLSSYEAHERIKRSSQGSVRETVSFQAFGDIAIPLPPLDTQLKITALLNVAKKEIDLLKRQHEALRKQKRGLMQKLLSGEWRIKTATEER